MSYSIYAYSGSGGLFLLETNCLELFEKYGGDVRINNWPVENCFLKGLVRWSGDKEEGEIDPSNKYKRLEEWIGKWVPVSGNDIWRLGNGVSVVGRDSPGFRYREEDVAGVIARGGVVDFEVGRIKCCDGSFVELRAETMERLGSGTPWEGK